MRLAGSATGTLYGSLAVILLSEVSNPQSETHGRNPTDGFHQFSPFFLGMQVCTALHGIVDEEAGEKGGWCSLAPILSNLIILGTSF